MSRLTEWSLVTATGARRAGIRPDGAALGLRLRTLTVLALAATLALAVDASAFREPAKGQGTLPNFDSRDSKSASAAADAARGDLAQSLGAQGVVSSDGKSAGARRVARTDGFLTAGSGDDASAIALDYVRDHRTVFGLSDDDLAALRVSSRYTSPDGVTHVAYVQTDQGIRAYDNVLYANVAKGGRLLNIGGAAAGGLRANSAAASIGAVEALLAARANVKATTVALNAKEGAGAERPTTFSNGDTARLTLFADASSTRLAWLVNLVDDRSLAYESVVDAASGKVLLRRTLTEFVSNASIYQNHPGAAGGGAALTVDLNADPTWLDRSVGFTTLSGNNAFAYADMGGIDGFDAGEQIPPSAGTNWVYPITKFNVAGQPCPLLTGTPACTWDSNNNATKTTNRNQTTTQLFYSNNRFHDHLKAAPIGFTHAARNFEFTDADGGGPGLGNDPVLSEANDASGTNNANMSTPTDGGSPRMQMYFWLPATARASLNSDDAADVVFHEYTHGLSNRTVGTGAGMSANQSRAMGEGWSDWYGEDFLVGAGHVTDTAANGELKLGDYLVNLYGPGGIRRQPLDCAVGAPAGVCPGTAGAGPGGFTLGDMGSVGAGFGFHDDGEIWAETLWDLRTAVGVSAARGLVTNGMRLSPNNPSFLEARDGIIQAAVAAGGTHTDTAWAVFANRGMGFSASTAGSGATTATEAFDLPPGPLVPDGSTIGGGDGDGTLEPGESFSLDQAMKNIRATARTGVTSSLSETDPNLTLTQNASSYPNIAAGATQSNLTPFAGTLSASAPCGQPVALSMSITTAEEGAKTVALSIPTGNAGASQAFTQGVAVAIPDDNPTGASSTLSVSGVGRISDVNVRMNITHPYVGDLEVRLTSPDGTVVTLVDNRGGSGDNFVTTVFDDEAATAISAGAAPYTGSFRPEQPLSALDGEDADGTWTLRAIDQASADIGTLNSWGLDITNVTCSIGDPSGRSDGSVRGDFNGDGIGDLAVGAPGEDIGASTDAGVVHVMNGSAAGLTAAGSQYWNQNSAGIADAVEPGDGFGSTLSAGDFNGDGRDDLAIGAGSEDIGATVDAGVVHVLYGSPAGLTSAGSQYWNQNSAGLADAVETGDRFGSALANGRLNNDVFAELVVGVAAEDVGTTVDAGVVQVLPGAAAGLTTAGSGYWHQNVAGIADTVEAGDGFGGSLAVGSIDNIVGQDLAVGVGNEDVGATVDAGAVHAIYGSAAGLTTAGSQYWDQNSAGVADAVEARDRFGSVLAAGSFNNDAFAELAVGVPDEDVGPSADAGVVHVLVGAAAGLTAAGSQYWQQNSAGIADAVEPGDGFGGSLAVGAMNNVVGLDLAIGAGAEDIGATVDAGVVHVIYGSAAGLAAAGSQYWHQNAAGIADAVETGDRFGSALATGRLNNDAFFELVVGVPDEDVGPNTDAGVVQILPGAAAGVTAAGSQYWHQNVAGIADAVEPGDGFGGALGS